ncbi:MAG: histidine phosphatase family protein [Xanthomonadales bacterium]|nr:histidine phosphatase family protein [Xanthomonadales bacterium]
MNRIPPIALILAAATATCAVAAEAPQAAPKAAVDIVLVRHGHYVADPGADESLGPGLSPIGVAQARLAGARLRALPNRFDALYVSPMQRARDTAATIGADLPGQSFKVLPDLAECTPPTRRTEIMAKEKPESMAACKAALDRVFDAHFRPADGAPRSELLVCHGNVIRYLVTRALGVDTTAWLEMSVGHASLTRIRVEPDGRYKVISIGDVGHLAPNLMTGATGNPERSLAVPELSIAE